MDPPAVSRDQPTSLQLAMAIGRVLRARRSLIGSKNENKLSGKASRQSSTQDGNRTISGETLVDKTSPSVHSDGDTIQLALEQREEGEKELGGSEKTMLPRRMSTRLGTLAKAKDEVQQALTVLGQRGRNAVSQGKRSTVDVAKDIQRRASLRPRLGVEDSKENGVPSKKAMPDTKTSSEENGEPVSKKAKLPDAKTSTKDPLTITVAQVTQPKPKSKVKRWLSHGLYIGQDRCYDGRLTAVKNRVKTTSEDLSDYKENSILPLPMFTGEKLLEIGRDFKLPYDIFAPLPPGQPKPEEWKKTQKSKFRLYKLHDCVFKRKMMSLIVRNRCLRW